MAGNRTYYVCELSAEQMEQLRQYLEKQGYTLDSIPYSAWRASKDKTTVVAYRSGKLLIQGRNTAHLVQYVLEPEILKEARFGYETELLEAENPEMFRPHVGIDESGKGDYFGPLVVAGVYVDAETARELARAEVTDSKNIKSDKRALELAGEIRRICGENIEVLTIGPEAYNRNYQRMGNLNRLLAWAHARTLENILERIPSCPKAVVDQFAAEKHVENALFERGQNITIQQVPKAESDVAVAAASIIARAEFLRRLETLGEKTGVALPKGASDQVEKAAKDIFHRDGTGGLQNVAKLHFKTTDKVKQGH